MERISHPILVGHMKAKLCVRPMTCSEPLIDTKVNEFLFFDRFFDDPEKAQYIDVGPDAEESNP